MAGSPYLRTSRRYGIEVRRPADEYDRCAIFGRAYGLATFPKESQTVFNDVSTDSSGVRYRLDEIDWMTPNRHGKNAAHEAREDGPQDGPTDHVPIQDYHQRRQACGKSPHTVRCFCEREFGKVVVRRPRRVGPPIHGYEPHHGISLQKRRGSSRIRAADPFRPKISILRFAMGRSDFILVRNDACDSTMSDFRSMTVDGSLRNGDAGDLEALRREESCVEAQ